MKRRNFVRTTALGSLALGIGGWSNSAKTHILSLSFDDGFKKSFYKASEIHEAYGLKACLNVIASGHMRSFKAIDKWILPELLGNFDDWNTLKQRGHEVMPHTWQHDNLTKIPIEQAKENIDKCLDYFEEHLEGYEPSESVYNFAFNASNIELDNYALQRVQAVRTGAHLVLKDSLINKIPVSSKPVRLGCWGKGPGFGDDYVEEQVNAFLKGSGGWMIINLHGLDDEGWGPLRTSYLDNLLKRLVKIDYLDVLPTGEVLKQLKK